MEFLKRKHIRSRTHEYSRSGICFVTTTIFQGACLLGKASPDKIELSDLGEISQRIWKEIPDHFPHVMLDKFIVMPNHIHGFIRINGTIRACPDCIINCYSTNKLGRQPNGSLAIVIGQFKASFTRWAKKNNYGSLFSWHSKFYDRIIRDESELKSIRNYNLENQKRWWAKYGGAQW